MGDKKNLGNQNEIRRLAKAKQKVNSRKGKSAIGSEGFNLQDAKKEQRKRQYAIEQAEREKEQERLAEQARRQPFNDLVARNIATLQATEGKRPAIRDLLAADLPHQDDNQDMDKVYEWVLIRYRSKPQTKKSA
jgi:hypothetical protein